MERIGRTADIGAGAIKSDPTKRSKNIHVHKAEEQMEVRDL